MSKGVHISFFKTETKRDVKVCFRLSTVDGRNPKQPHGMYKTLQIIVYLLYQLVQDFFHQPYHGSEHWQMHRN